ncbi:MAG: hypothetical protein WBH44_04365 [Proteocatella sp.]
MKDVTETFMEEEEREAQEKRLGEFKLLAKHIKQRIYELMLMGDGEEALSVIHQLQSVTPDDNELNELKKRINIK